LSGRARCIQGLFSSLFILDEQFTGSPVKCVKPADTIAPFAELLDGKLDDLPEQAFYIASAIDGRTFQRT
jgi:F-type H+-transporting ATPase subunit beta